MRSRAQLRQLEEVHRRNQKHGHAIKGAQSPEYQSWQTMIQRCTNPHTVKWHLYGGRGIRVCERWRNFANFLADMGEKPLPKKKYSLDRFPDRNGNYEMGNCRWATAIQQARNSRTTRLTIRDVQRIRYLAAKGMQLKVIAVRFSVNASHVSRIVSGKKWSE